MNKLFVFLWISLFCINVVYAQSYEGQIDYRNTKQPAALIRLPYTTGPVKDALKEYMNIRGFKSSSPSHFILFRGVRLDSGETDLRDLYFTLESAGRKEKDMTIVSLLAVKKNQDIAVRTPDGNSWLVAARLFLDSLALFTDTYNTRLQVNSQQDVLNKAQKKMNGLISDQADLEKRIRRLQTDLDQNKKDQVKALADLQANVNADDDTKRKGQKKVNRLMDDQGDLEKKLRRTQLDLDQNKIGQGQQQAVIDKQKQGLAAIKARQNP
jgi:hypothetical protein